jgi:tRNA(Ile2) C34 agmatinyltransferase TiaS
MRDTTHMEIRKRRAKEIADDFEKDLPDRLERWRVKAAEFERVRHAPCPDCGGHMKAQGGSSTCAECRLRRGSTGKISRPGQSPSYVDRLMST